MLFLTSTVQATQYFVFFVPQRAYVVEALDRGSIARNTYINNQNTILRSKWYGLETFLLVRMYIIQPNTLTLRRAFTASKLPKPIERRRTYRVEWGIIILASYTSVHSRYRGATEKSSTLKFELPLVLRVGVTY